MEKIKIVKVSYSEELQEESEQAIKMLIEKILIKELDFDSEIQGIILSD
ncbi:MAG: hypothetical protein Q8934_10755 [Bacillota bacterium]|nr:hypothetical protein [Bacillota bacterium]